MLRIALKCTHTPAGAGRGRLSVDNLNTPQKKDHLVDWHRMVATFRKRVTRRRSRLLRRLKPVPSCCKFHQPTNPMAGNPLPPLRIPRSDLQTPPLRGFLRESRWVSSVEDWRGGGIPLSVWLWLEWSWRAYTGQTPPPASLPTDASHTASHILHRPAPASIPHHKWTIISNMIQLIYGRREKSPPLIGGVNKILLINLWFRTLVSACLRMEEAEPTI